MMHYHASEQRLSRRLSSSKWSDMAGIRHVRLQRGPTAKCQKLRMLSGHFLGLKCAAAPHLELIAIDLLLLKQHIGHLVQHANVGLDEVLCAPAYHRGRVSKAQHHQHTSNKSVRLF